MAAEDEIGSVEFREVLRYLLEHGFVWLYPDGRGRLFRRDSHILKIDVNDGKVRRDDYETIRQTVEQLDQED